MDFIFEILIIISCILIAIAQTLFKKGLEKKEFNFKKPISILFILFSPKIFAGLFLYFLAFLVYMFSLSNIKLSIAYPLLSFSFIFVTLFAVIFLKEKISIKRALGIAFIFIGVALVNL
ncbi:MAG: EamA family transporter [Candidatus Micrarchaeales archaeon]|jgi:drug/metabolite transporter (DMT)-like permease